MQKGVRSRTFLLSSMKPGPEKKEKEESGGIKSLRRKERPPFHSPVPQGRGGKKSRGLSSRLLTRKSGEKRKKEGGKTGTTSRG